MYSTLVAGLDEQLDICVHEGNCHSHSRSVGKNKVGVLAEAFDGVEDVVPATAVEAGRVVTELVDDLVHLEGSCDSLNQNSCANGTSSHANVVLGEVEGIIPKPGLEVGFHLREVEVWAKSSLH